MYCFLESHIPSEAAGCCPLSQKRNQMGLKSHAGVQRGPSGNGHEGETHAELDKQSPIEFSPPRSPGRILTFACRPPTGVAPLPPTPRPKTTASPQ